MVAVEGTVGASVFGVFVAVAQVEDVGSGAVGQEEDTAAVQRIHVGKIFGPL